MTKLKILNNISDHGRAIVLLVIGAFGISFSPAIAKLLGQNIIGPTAIGFWRTAIGGVVLCLIALAGRKSLKLPLPVAAWCIFTGFFFFLDLSIWHRSILYVGSGMSTVLGNTQVFITALLSYFLFKEKLSLRFILSAVAALCGVAMLVGVLSQSVQFTPIYIRGIVYGLLTALMYALYMVGIKKASSYKSKPDPLIIMAWICCSASVFLGAGSYFEEAPFLPPDLYAVSLITALGVIIQALTWWLITHAMRKVAVHHAALVLLLQPILAMVWGYFFFTEVLALSQVLGAVIALTAIYVGSTKKKN